MCVANTLRAIASGLLIHVCKCIVDFRLYVEGARCCDSLSLCNAYLCCSVLQCVAVCCSVLHCDAVTLSLSVSRIFTLSLSLQGEDAHMQHYRVATLSRIDQITGLFCRM